MEQTKALNALAPFLALAKSATTPRQAADIVTQATKASNTYVFAELLSTNAIQSLRSDERFSGHYRLLEIFTWGTWADYEANSSSLPPLSAQQQTKLRLLTLLTLASTVSDASVDLSYSTLTQRLTLPSAHELEELVTTAIYADLVKATLDPAAQLVAISSVAPLRDLAPGSAAALVAELAAWSARCEDVLADLDGRIAAVKTEAEARAKRDKAVAAERERAETRFNPHREVEEQGKGKGGGGVLSSVDGDAMDVDAEHGKKKKKWFSRK